MHTGASVPVRGERQKMGYFTFSCYKYTFNSAN